MATINGTLTFALPEDIDSDVLELYNSVSKEGTYSLSEQSAYEYGTTRYEPVSLDDVLWYRIRFVNTGDGTEGPFSDPVWGGTWSSSAPFLAVSSTTDGANYATTEDLYEYSGLTSEDVPASRVSAALRRARAVIDYRTAEMDLERFDVFPTGTARRKYNASLRLIKEAELNIALGNLYTNLSDDLIIENIREGAGSIAGTVSIGSTSVSGDTLAERSENILYLAALADRYFAQGENLLSSLDTNSVKLVPFDLSIGRSPRFRLPFNGF